MTHLVFRLLAPILNWGDNLFYRGLEMSRGFILLLEDHSSTLLEECGGIRITITFIGVSTTQKFRETVSQNIPTQRGALP
jgi:hypothetical protein